MSKLMRGKTVVITGATSGIGYYSALEIANLGSHVILVGRNSERGKSAVESITKESGNPEIEFIMGDVSQKKVCRNWRIASIKAFLKSMSSLTMQAILETPSNTTRMVWRCILQ